MSNTKVDYDTTPTTVLVYWLGAEPWIRLLAQEMGEPAPLPDDKEIPYGEARTTYAYLASGLEVLISSARGLLSDGEDDEIFGVVYLDPEDDDKENPPKLGS